MDRFRSLIIVPNDPQHHSTAGYNSDYSHSRNTSRSASHVGIQYHRMSTHEHYCDYHFHHIASENQTYQQHYARHGLQNLRSVTFCPNSDLPHNNHTSQERRNRQHNRNINYERALLCARANGITITSGHHCWAGRTNLDSEEALLWLRLAMAIGAEIEFHPGPEEVNRAGNSFLHHIAPQHGRLAELRDTRACNRRRRNHVASLLSLFSPSTYVPHRRQR